MSTGSASIPLLKAAPEADQVAERLAGGPVGRARAVPHAGRRARRRVRRARRRRRAPCRRRVPGRRSSLTAEAPVSWPSGAFVRVDRLDAEARAGHRAQRAVRGRDRLAGPHDPPLHPADAGRAARVRPASTSRPSRRSCAATRRSAASAASLPLIENVPPVLRMRTGGVFLTPIGGHWRDLRSWRARVPALGFTLDTSHAALFHTFAGAYPSLWGLEGEEGLELGRYVEELGPAGEVAHVSNAAGVLGEGHALRRGRAGPRPRRRADRRAVPVRRRRDQRARPRALPVHEGGVRAVARALPNARRPVAAPAAPGARRAVRLAARHPPARPRPRGARARGGARRAARARDRRRGLDRPVAHDAARGLPPGAHHGARRARGGAHRRPPGSRRGEPRPLRARAVRRARPRAAGGGVRAARRPTSSCTSPPTSTSTGRSVIRRSSRRRTSTGAGTSCAARRRPARHRRRRVDGQGCAACIAVRAHEAAHGGPRRASRLSAPDRAGPPSGS